MYRAVILRCFIFFLMAPGQVLIAQRAFTVDDLLREEAIAQVKLSPDGRWLAYVQVRSKSAAETYQKNFFVRQRPRGHLAGACGGWVAAQSHARDFRRQWLVGTGVVAR